MPRLGYISCLLTREKSELTGCSSVSRPQGSLWRHRGLQVPGPGQGVPTCPSSLTTPSLRPEGDSSGEACIELFSLGNKACPTASVINSILLLVFEKYKKERRGNTERRMRPKFTGTTVRH